MVREGGKDLHFEGSFPFCSKFQVNNVPFEVSGFEPYFISCDEGCEFGLNSTFHGLPGELVGSRGFISCPDELIKSFFYSREVGLIGNIRECLWFVSHDEIEWGFAGGGVRSDIVDEFCHGYLFSPFGRV